MTRRPLVLQLIRCPLDDKKYRSIEKGTVCKVHLQPEMLKMFYLGTVSLDEWGEFLHKEGEIFNDFDAIRKEIEQDTDRVAGDNKGICDEPINLKIYSYRVVDLTLVDLPGLTKVPVGDQPTDIEIQIKKLIFKYIENENCIILAVTAANVDIATSEALKFAKEVDVNGSRTLAVLTKIGMKFLIFFKFVVAMVFLITIYSPSISKSAAHTYDTFRFHFVFRFDGRGYRRK